jgi:hypothetical protein
LPAFRRSRRDSWLIWIHCVFLLFDAPNQSLERMQAGAACSQIRMSVAACIAQFCVRWQDVHRPTPSGLKFKKNTV